uniref:Uncharacterized protein n=1 Tax=Salarias fasciatus TaxID=181472 RepID=A0A672GCD1_SALFA
SPASPSRLSLVIHSRKMGFDKLETSSVSTAFTVAPSVSSSSSALSSVAPLSSANMDCDLKSPSSMHDSTISRLIDAVSLDNEQDTCGSISALIGQFENTVDQNSFQLLHESTPSRHSNYRPTDPQSGRVKVSSQEHHWYMSSSVNDCYQFLPDSAGKVFPEVELNVDEDPLERMLASPAHGSQWDGLTSPTKRHAIYQNHSYTSCYPQQKQPLSYRSPQQEYSSHSPHQIFCPVNSGPLSKHPQSPTVDSTNPSPCKSKSLGDLTSEDISCNFQSKYHIISRRWVVTGGDTFQTQSCDPLTEQLRKLVSLEGDDSDRDRDRPQPPQEATYPHSHPQTTGVAPTAPRDVDDSPPLLTRRLSSRSQSRVRVVINSTASIGGVVLRNKPASQNPPANRHSTGSYIAGYFGQLEDRGLPEGACTSLLYGSGTNMEKKKETKETINWFSIRLGMSLYLYHLNV